MGSKLQKRRSKFALGPQRRHRPTGQMPGTVEAPADALRPSMRLLAYGPSAIVEQEIAGFAEFDASAWRATHPVVWLDVIGVGDTDTIHAIGEQFGLHGLALEDVVNVNQRPKTDVYDDHTFIVARMLEYSEQLATEQVSLFVGEGYVITFQERVGDCFDSVRDRIRKSRGRIRDAGADYLVYALLDAIVDRYFPVIEAYGDRLESLEEQIFDGAHSHVVQQLMHVRQELILMRRATWPMRDAVNVLMREQTAFFEPSTQVYLRDCFDHVLRVIDLVENYREFVSGLMDVNLSMVSHKLNEVMKVLTIIATIFIPLGFVAGLYGMNFDTASPWNMPELSWAYGYPAALGLMATIAIGLLIFFRRRGWLGGEPTPVAHRTRRER